MNFIKKDNYVSSSQECDCTFKTPSSSSSNDLTRIYQHGKIQLDKKQGEECMSIVGIFRTKDGFIGFGDGKSTKRLFPNRTDLIMSQTERGVIKKVFKNDNFILCTFGPNQIGPFNIEDYIKDNLENKKAYDFFNDFSKFLKMYTSEQYSFIIAEKNKDMFFVNVTAKNISYNRIESNVALGGCDAYYDNLFVLEWQLLNYSCLDAKEILLKQLHITYDYIEKLCIENRLYNPADNNFTFEILKTDN